MKIKLDEGAFIPERAHDTDAGLDLRSMDDKIVPAGGSMVFDTGVHVELPMVALFCDEMIKEEHGYKYPNTYPFIPKQVGTVGFLKSKSGLNVNHNITSEGVIDMGYTGSIKVKLYNHGMEDYHIKRGDKISQLVILPILTPNIEIVSELEETERGENGFGSSGR